MPKLRVISGSVRGRRLNTVPGDSTRPITDRVKEALFNILRADIPGCRFLDLFAGTGSVGIEALSVGAEHVRFCDSHKLAIQTLHENLEVTGFRGKAEVVQGDAFVMLSKPPKSSFDYVYIAPPQYMGMWKKALQYLDKTPDWLVEDGWAIAQIHPKEYEPLTLNSLSEFDQRKYGNTLLVFYEREP